MNPADFRIFLNVIIAMALGAVIGLDRGLSGKPAGLRTHMLVAGVSALFVSLGSAFLVYFGTNAPEGAVRIQSDPIRIMEAVVTGVSFLGAGTIIRGASDSARGIKGLTTAASLLFVAAIGICVALSKFALSIGLTVTTVLILRLLGTVEKTVISRISSRTSSSNVH
ncbi:MAG: MgtC/SapB family protein [Candidatus Omnitrophica bacterium]|nr:MgtC/SapB family protein [Candidatus Omnitrophota bacterium]